MSRNAERVGAHGMGVTKIRAGASRASADRFEALYRDHYTDVFAYVVRRANPEAAHDVVADTFVVAWRKIDRVPAEPLPWLLAVARRTLANHRRSMHRRERLLRRMATERAPAPDALPSPGGLPSLLFEALTRLPEPDQEMLALIAWEGFSPSDVAHAFGITQVACRVRLHRARRRLHKEIDRIDAQKGAAVRPARGLG